MQGTCTTIDPRYSPTVTAINQPIKDRLQTIQWTRSILAKKGDPRCWRILGQNPSFLTQTRTRRQTGYQEMQKRDGTALALHTLNH